ncbi:MAG: glucokinase [Proteobacteria bacterium]|nr:glucokinase [Pseudomonadota bacterium]
MTMYQNYILAGDIGGTKTILAIAYFEGNRINWAHKKRFISHSYDSLDEMIIEFFSEISLKPIDVIASFGIAGPVQDGRVKTTNLPWHVDASELKNNLGFKNVNLVNDFKSIGLGIPYLKEQDLLILNEGLKDRNGHVAIIGAGTGLGQGLAIYSRAHKRYRVLPSEGGHCDFAPNNEEEIGLLRYLMQKYEHVSVEKVVSGLGLFNIYNYLAESGFAERSPETRKKLEAGDPAAVISSLAIEGSDALCVKALDMFASIYGAEAGNLALKALPSGGLYVGGGMAPKLKGKLIDGTFMKGFLNKGRLSEFMKSIPVYVILNEEVGLMGAAVRGSELYLNNKGAK